MKLSPVRKRAPIRLSRRSQMPGMLAIAAAIR